MAKVTTIPITQNYKIGHAWFVNGKGTIWQALQVNGTDYTAGSDGATLKSLIVNNSDTTAAPTILFGLLDPSVPTVNINAITASSSTAATAVTTNTLTGVTDTSALGKYMLLSQTGGNGTLYPGSFISALVSTSAFTLSKATTGASPTGTITAIPWQIIGAVTTPLGSGAASGGATANIDLLGSAVVVGLSYDAVGKPVLFVPSGYKIIVAALTAPTAPAAATGFFSVTGQIEEY